MRNGARAVGSHVTRHESEAGRWSVSSMQWRPLPKIQTLYSPPEGHEEATGGTETYSLPPRVSAAFQRQGCRCQSALSLLLC